MKVLLCLCAWIAAVTAHGVISYPVPPLNYHSTYISPLTTITRPVGITYTGFHGYPLPLGQYFSYGVIPNNVVFTGVPGVVHFIPLAPTNGKGKPDKKKPKDKDDKDKKEETTEEPKKEEEEEGEAESKTDETEDLAQ